MSFYWAEREFIRPNRPVIYDLRSANVFYALVPRRAAEMNRLLTYSISGERDPKTGLRIARPETVLSSMGSRLICTADRDALSCLPIAEDSGTWVARRNDGAMPLAYFARSVMPCRTPDEALRQMCSEGFDSACPAVEVGPGAGVVIDAGGPVGQVLETRNERGHLTVRCRTPGNSLLVVRETFDRHFRCTVDGVPTEVLRANYLFRAVPMGPGEHTVEFAFVCPELRIGMVISLFTILGMLGYLLVGRAMGVDGTK